MWIDNAVLSRNELKGKVAVVTGAGQGIGKETARVLAHIGAAVVIAEINDTGLETERLIHADGGQALFVRTDVADPASMGRLHRQIAGTFGEVDVLVNNAVVYEAKAVLDHTVEEWDRVFAVNLRGAFLGIKEFLPKMLERGYGVVITMESAEGMPYMASYLATKVGLRSLAMSLAAEVGAQSGVSVYCFGPGMVETPTLVKAVQQIAPLYGLSQEEFMRQSGVELICAELCATGLVGTILYAQEFHGQETAWPVGLTKLGLTTSGERWEPEARPTPVKTPAAPEGPSSLVQQAIALNRQVEDMMRSNVEAYEGLTLFQRPIAKRMFQQGAGLKVEDWLASAEEMTRLLESGTPIEPARLAPYVAQLKRLADFLVKQESDARGWFKDAEQLRVALAALHDRRETALKLTDLLIAMQEE